MNKKTPTITVEDSRKNRLQGSIPILPEDWLDPDRAKHLGERIRHLKTQMLSQFVDEQYTGRHFVISFDEYPPSRLELAGFHTDVGLFYRVQLTVSEVLRHDISLPYLEPLPALQWDHPSYLPRPVTESFVDLLKFKFWKWRQ